MTQTNKEHQRADDIIGHDVSGTDSVSLKNKETMEERFDKKFIVSWQRDNDYIDTVLDRQAIYAFIHSEITRDRQQIVEMLKKQLDEEDPIFNKINLAIMIVNQLGRKE